MEFKVVKINHEFKNVVVSHKALIEADIEEQKREIIGQLEKGQVLEGVVKNITSYGVFIDLGGVDGLIHITDLSWSRINHPSEVLELDQKLNVVILDFDEDKSRIQLGLKQLSAHPWDALSADLNIGDKVKGKVVVLADYGAFIEVAEGVEGLIHVSEMSWSTHLRSAQDFVKVGDVIDAVILTLDREDRKMSLGIKQLEGDPFNNYVSTNDKGALVKGTVKTVESKGAVVTLSVDVEGYLRASEMAAGRVEDATTIYNEGDEVEAMIINVDRKARSIQLSIKAMDTADTAQSMQRISDSSASAGTTNLGALLRAQLEQQREDDTE